MSNWKKVKFLAVERNKESKAIIGYSISKNEKHTKEYMLDLVKKWNAGKDNKTFYEICENEIVVELCKIHKIKEERRHDDRIENVDGEIESLEGVISDLEISLENLRDFKRKTNS